MLLMANFHLNKQIGKAVKKVGKILVLFNNLIALTLG